MFNKRVRILKTNFRLHESGEAMTDYFEVGVNGVKSITEFADENEPRNFLIEKGNGITIRVYNPNFIEYLK